MLTASKIEDLRIKARDSFGMITFGRSWEVGSDYRYGFNGKESDSETYGDGNVYDYGFRIYNPRLGKFLSVDPLANSFPWYTPYQFSGNTPIWAIDIDGLEDKKTNEGTGSIISSSSDPNTVANTSSSEDSYLTDPLSFVVNQKPDEDALKFMKTPTDDLDAIGTFYGGLAITADAIEKLGGLDKASKLIEEGKFEVIYNDQLKTWSLKFYVINMLVLNLWKLQKQHIKL
jgi:RHS repeat-associated protein